MPTGNAKSLGPSADARHLAALFAIERAGTLVLLAASLFAIPRLARPLESLAGPAVAAWFCLLLTVAAALAMRLTLPLWCRLYPGVRLGGGYFRQAWPDWAYACAAPLYATGIVLHHPGWMFLALPLFVAGHLAPTVSCARLLRRLNASPASKALMLPPAALALLDHEGLTAAHVRLDPERPDLVAWTPPARRPVILLGLWAAEKLTGDELTAVIAHELGHLRRHHAGTAALLQFAGWLVVAALLGGALLLALPDAHLLGAAPPFQAVALAVPAAFLLAALLETLAGPLAAALGRRQERQANAWAVRHLADVDISAGAFLSMLHKVHDLLGRPPEPPWWHRLLFGDYPSLKETLARLGKTSQGE